MSRAFASSEKEALKRIRERRALENEDNKECGNVNCSEMGVRQPLDNFYKRRGGKVDSYCILCRKEMAKARREHAEFLPREEKPKRIQKWKKKEAPINISKAPWCKEHRSNSKLCGCAEGRFYIRKVHREKIAKALKGNANALGKHKKRGPHPLEHRIKIAASVRAALARKKEIKDGNDTRI